MNNDDDDDEIAIIEPTNCTTSDDHPDPKIPEEPIPNQTARSGSISNGKRRRSEGVSSTSTTSSASHSSRSSSRSSEQSDNGSYSLETNNINSDTNELF